MEVRASAMLKRVAPLISDARPAKLGTKHHSTRSCWTPGRGGSGDPPRGRSFFGDGSGNSTVSGSHFRSNHDNDIDRLLREQMKGIALEKEKMDSSRKRAASFAAGDEEFLESFDASLTGSGAASGSGGSVLPEFDQKWVTTLALDSTDREKAGENAEDQGYEARRQRAAATLSLAEYRCWELREEIDGYRRQEEKIRAQIFNGDPLLPLWGGLGEGER